MPKTVEADAIDAAAQYYEGAITVAHPGLVIEV
jgi:hypothetical protein